ncbi:tetratricopeptide repeat protein [Massilia sp. H-1]|nr:tetratricopeptide repeat protein [Massilia sp. H-1]
MAGGRNMNDEQRAERQYREAIALLDEGRVSAAMEALGQTLKLNPRHDGARQSLVNLLIEGGRKDEAMQQLEQGLERDPAQAQMAMLLARLQIERGQSGVPTLMRSLPSVTGNADYHAFLGRRPAARRPPARSGRTICAGTAQQSRAGGVVDGDGHFPAG